MKHILTTIAILAVWVGNGWAQDSSGVRALFHLYQGWEGAGDFTIDGQTALLASGKTGMRILDISNPTNPVEVSSCLVGMKVTKVVANTSHAFATGTTNGIYVVNLSPNRLNPELVAHFTELSTVYDLAITGNYLYVAAGSAGLVILNVTNPDSIYIVNRLFRETTVFEIRISNLYGQVTTTTQGLIFLNLNNPVAPTIRSRVPTNYYGGLQGTLFNNLFYLSGGGSLRGYDINQFDTSQESTIPIARLVSLDTWDPYSQINTITVNGSNLYVTGYVIDTSHGQYLYSIWVYSIQNPSAPVLTRIIFINRIEFRECTYHSGLLYLTDGYTFYTFDPNLPSAERGRLSWTGLMTNVAVQDSVLFVDHVRTGLTTYNISNQNEPSLIFSDSTFVNGQAIVIRDTLCFLLNQDIFKVINIRNPAQPIPLGLMPVSVSTVNGVAITDSLAFLYGHPQQPYAYLRIIDISNPSDLRTIFNWMYLPIYGLAVRNRTAYMATGNSGFKIWDFSNFFQPTLLDSIVGYFQDVFLAGHCAFATRGSGGLSVINVQRPDSAYIAMSIYISNVQSKKVKVFGNYAFVSTEGGGSIYGPIVGSIRIINISNLQNLHEVGFYSFPEYIQSFVVKQNNIFVTHGASTSILDFSQAVPVIERDNLSLTLPTEFALNQNYPNPFNSETKIQYALPRTSLINLALYDVQGRLVKSLIRGLTQDAGIYTITLDGAGLASGVYYVKLSAGEYTQARKVVMIK